MSKERQRARAAREAARAEELARAARQREKQARRARRRPALPARAPRQRRFGALPTRVRLGLLFGWLTAQLFAWQVFTGTRTRLGVALVTLVALPLVVVITHDPRRRRS